MDIMVNDVMAVPSVTETISPEQREAMVLKKALDNQKIEGQAVLEMLAKITQKGQSIDLKI